MKSEASVRCKLSNGWVITALCLDFLVIATTYALLAFLSGTEHNPVANAIFKAVGLGGGLAIMACLKVIVVFGLWLLITYLPQRSFIKFVDNFSKIRHEKFNFSHWRFLIHCAYAGAYAFLAYRLFVVAHNAGEIFTGIIR